MCMSRYEEKIYNFGFASFDTLCVDKVASVTGAQITPKPDNAAYPLSGFFYSFLNWSLMPDLFGLLISVPKTNRLNVTIPFNSILSFQGKNLDESQMIPETVSWFSNP